MPSPEQWLGSPLGQIMLEGERRVTSRVLARVFGLQLVQVGLWGEPGRFISEARTAFASVVAPADVEGVSMRCDAAHLALQPSSVDAVLLPHTLELHGHPHEVLREAERVLVGEGRLVVLGFNPVGLWGLRRVLSRGRFPAGTLRLIPEWRLRDWLKLLGFEVERVEYHCHRLPIHTSAPAAGEARLERLAPRFQPNPLAGGYLLLARKRVYSMTPVRPVLVPKKAVVGGLVNTVPRDGVAAMDRPPREPGK